MSAAGAGAVGERPVPRRLPASRRGGAARGAATDHTASTRASSNSARPDSGGALHARTAVGWRSRLAPATPASRRMADPSASITYRSNSTPSLMLKAILGPVRRPRRIAVPDRVVGEVRPAGAIGVDRERARLVARCPASAGIVTVPGGANTGPMLHRRPGPRSARRATRALAARPTCPRLGLREASSALDAERDDLRRRERLGEVHAARSACYRRPGDLGRARRRRPTTRRSPMSGVRLPLGFDLSSAETDASRPACLRAETSSAFARRIGDAPRRRSNAASRMSTRTSRPAGARAVAGAVAVPQGAGRSRVAVRRGHRHARRMARASLRFFQERLVARWDRLRIDEPGGAAVRRRRQLAFLVASPPGRRGLDSPGGDGDATQPILQAFAGAAIWTFDESPIRRSPTRTSSTSRRHARLPRQPRGRTFGTSRSAVGPAISCGAAQGPPAAA